MAVLYVSLLSCLLGDICAPVEQSTPEDEKNVKVEKVLSNALESINTL